MKKHFRPIIATFCVGVLLFAGFILAVNLYVQSKGVQTRIRMTLSESIGMPVEMFRATFSPWGGFRLDQIKVMSDLPTAKVDFLKAECLEVRCEFIPLLKGQVVLRRIALDAPKVVFQKNAMGQYRLPRQPILLSNVPPSRPTIMPEAIHTPVLKVTSPTSSAGVAKAKLPACDLDIRKLLLRNGHFRFLAEDGSELLRMEAVRCSLNAKTLPNTFSGTLEIKKAIILNRWEITDLEASVTLDNQKLHIDKLSGNLAEGHIEGEANVNLAEVGQPYNLWLRLSKADLANFFPAGSDFAADLVGLVHARLEYEGFITDEVKNKGHAELKISRAKITHLPFLEILSQLISSEEYGNLSIKKMEVKADITGPLVQITPSYVQSDHVQFTFFGPMDASQNLNLKAQLIIEDGLFKKLPSEARENFVKTPDAKQQTLDFTITGPVTGPQTNLINRLIGDKLEKKFKSFLGNTDKDSGQSKPSPKQ